MSIEITNYNSSVDICKVKVSFVIRWVIDRETLIQQFNKAISILSFDSPIGFIISKLEVMEFLAPTNVPLAKFLPFSKRKTL